METDTTFIARELLERLQKQARAAAETGTGPDGWTVSEKDPTDMVRVFKTLRVKSGFKLVGYQFRSGSNGNGVVHAFPVEEDPDLRTAEWNQQLFLKPPIFRHALPHFMDAIEGDGTALSYLSASVLMRELYEFGAEWHGCYWSDHRLLDADPKIDLIKDKSGWRWKTRRAIEWRPHVTQAKNRVTSSFCTFTGLGHERIMQHIDTFKHGWYRPVTTFRNVAVGPIGYIT